MALGLGAAALIGGGSLLGGVLGANAQKDAADAAARASLFRGVPITSGIGSVTTSGTPGNISFETELSPEMQALRDQLLGVGTQTLDQFQTFDPREAGTLFTQQLTDIAAPREKEERLALENRLFQQGLLGSTTGAKRSEALFGAQNLAAQQRDLTGLLEGEQQQARLFERALGGIQGATTIDQLLSNQLSQAIGAGGAQTAGNTAGAQFQFQAGQNRADAISGFFGQLGQGLSQFAFQPQSAPPAPLFSGTPNLSVPGTSMLNINPAAVSPSLFQIGQ